MNTLKRAFLFEFLAIAAGLALALSSPPQGLEQKAMWVLGMIVWGVINWISRAIPDFSVFIIMCCLWVILGIIPFDNAFGAFSRTTVWLLVGALGIGVAVTKSGLISRAALYIMKLCAPTFAGQVFAIMLAGLILSPFIPSTVAKVAVAGSLSTAIGGKLGLRDRSSEMTGLWNAMYTGFSLSSPIILSASYFGYMIMSLMPPETQDKFTFSYWLLAMLPWGMLLYFVIFISIITIYRPKERISLKKKDIDAMIIAMGPVSMNEKITLAVIIGCMVCWVTEKQLGIPPVVPALGGTSALLSLRVITREDYSTKISWSLITFVGCAIGLTSVIVEVGLDKWIAVTYASLLGGIVTNVYLFFTVLAIAVVLTRFVIIDAVVCFTLYIVVLMPFCADAGISPWVLGICVYVFCQPWFVRYQNLNFIIGFSSAGGDEKISFSKTVIFCFIYNIVALAGLFLSVPYWKIMGLIK